MADVEVQTDDVQTLVLSEATIAAAEMGQLEISPQQLSLFARLLQAAATPIPNSTLCVAQVGGTGGGTLLLAAPAPRVSDDAASLPSIGRRAANLEAFANATGAGVNTVAKWIRSDNELFSKASKISTIGRVELDASTSLHLQRELMLRRTKSQSRKTSTKSSY